MCAKGGLTENKARCAQRMGLPEKNAMRAKGENGMCTKGELAKKKAKCVQRVVLPENKAKGVQRVVYQKIKQKVCKGGFTRK